MQIKFSTPLLLLWACAAFPAVAADTSDIKLQENAPNRYIVKKGDTLWGIAGRFMKDPWRWPDIWGMNKAQIANPHWIYPGNVIVLDTSTPGNPKLRLEGEGTQAGGSRVRETVRLSPTVRVSELEQKAIPSIPAQEIEPFLNKTLITEKDGLVGTARIVDSQDKRVVLTSGNMAYVYGLDESKGTAWQVVRPGESLVSKRLGATLAYEAKYLGEARVQRFAEISTVEIMNAREEIRVGDRLLPAPAGVAVSYVPHAPETPVDGRVISLPGSLAEAGRDTVVALDLGREQGLEVGHVLALSRLGPEVKVEEEKKDTTHEVNFSWPYSSADTRAKTKVVKVPNERFGLLFVFRVFDKVSYGLVLSTSRQVEIGDMVSKP